MLASVLQTASSAYQLSLDSGRARGLKGQIASQENGLQSVSSRAAGSNTGTSMFAGWARKLKALVSSICA